MMTSAMERADRVRRRSMIRALMWWAANVGRPVADEGRSQKSTGWRPRKAASLSAEVASRGGCCAAANGPSSGREVAAGDPVEVVHRPAHGVSIRETFRALSLEPDLLPRLLNVPELPSYVREKVARRVGAGSR